MKHKIFHVIPNAHLDPVWLWDWREGLNEAIITTRTILDLMDEIPDLTFIRGEAAVYRQIEENDPVTFRRLERAVACGRWELVGGTMIQPDTNMPATEVFARHFLDGQRYFKSRFGRTVRVAWAADSFGHSAGLPAILSAAGIDGFSFSRPEQHLLPIPKAAFWWESAGGERIMSYRIPVSGYCSERHDTVSRLDIALSHAAKGDLRNVGVYLGLGNHGGGPTRRQIREIRQWAACHPDIDVCFSGLHRLIAALRAEAARQPPDFLPVVRGELNFCQRGCYASMARFKFKYRQAENEIIRTEMAATAIVAGVGCTVPTLAGAWDGLLFNTFHDILPGSSIERAYDEQLDWVGSSIHSARITARSALNLLAEQVDTSVPKPPLDHPAAVPFIVFNPHPREFCGYIELEAALDYRPIWPYHGKPDDLPVVVTGPDGLELPCQCVATEHTSFIEMAWRKRVVVPVKLPSMGWNVIRVGWQNKPTIRCVVKNAARAIGRGAIANGIVRVAARKGGSGIEVKVKGRVLFDAPGLQAVTVEDQWGSWGDQQEQPAGINTGKILHHWRVISVETLEKGPLRSALWVKLEGGRSRLELIFHVYAGRPDITVSVRLLWNERAARLKLVMPVCAGSADFDVPGGVMRRGSLGEVPGGRWVRTHGERGDFGFASDSLYCFDLTRGALRATVVRSTRFAADAACKAGEMIWQPATDQGEHRFKFLLQAGGEGLSEHAALLERPPMHQIVLASKGKLGRSGSFMTLEPATVILLALKPAADGRGYIVRVQETGGHAARVLIRWLGRPLPLGAIHPWQIASWRLTSAGGRWHVQQVDIVERRK